MSLFLYALNCYGVDAGTIISTLFVHKRLNTYICGNSVLLSPTLIVFGKWLDLYYAMLYSKDKGHPNQLYYGFHVIA